MSKFKPGDLLCEIREYNFRSSEQLLWLVVAGPKPVDFGSKGFKPAYKMLFQDESRATWWEAKYVERDHLVAENVSLEAFKVLYCE